MSRFGLWAFCALACSVACKNRDAGTARRDARASGNGKDAETRSRDDARSRDLDSFSNMTACEPAPTRLPSNLVVLERDLIAAFDGESLRSTIAAIRFDKVSEHLARDIETARDKKDIAANQLGNATDEIAFSAGACGQFEDAVRDTAKVFKEQKDSTFERLSDVVRCWWNTADARARLQMLETEMTKVRSRLSEIRAVNGADPRVSAIAAVEDKYLKFRTAVEAIRPASDAYASAWRELAVAFDKAASRSGMKPSNRKTLTSVLLAMPQIEEVSPQLEEATAQLRRIADIDRYTGAWGMCRNVAYSFSPSTTDAIDEGTVVSLKNKWDARAEAVRALIEQSLAVPGTQL